jgi:hypothetical protein
MSLRYNENAPKKPTNLTVNTDLYAEPKISDRDRKGGKVGVTPS